MAIQDYKVEIRDKTGTLQVTLTKISLCRWVYARLGGHLSAYIETPESFTASDLVRHWDLRILVDTGSGFTVRWRGYIVRAGRRRGEPDIYRIGAVGYIKRLERISVIGLGFYEEDGSAVFENLDAMTIASNLVGEASALIGWPGIDFYGLTSNVTVQKIEFNGSVAQAIRTLAEEAGMKEWGVVHSVATGNPTMNFRPPSSSIRYTATYGGDTADVLSLDEEYYSEEVVNRLYLVGRDFNAVLENSADLVADQVQTTDDEQRNFGGVSTIPLMVMQRFTTTYPMLSQLKLKLGKVGWSELVSDGDMEAAGTGSWTAGNSYSSLSKDTVNPYAGTQSLKCTHTSGASQYGWYQDVTVSASTTYQVSLRLRTQKEPVTIEWVDGSGVFGGTGKILDSRQAKSSDWTYYSSRITSGGTTLGIRVYAKNNRAGADPFWADNVSVVAAGSDVEVGIYEDDPINPDTYPTLIARAFVPFAEIPDVTPALITVPINGTPLYQYSGAAWGIRLSRADGNSSDTTYFRSRSNSEGGYANGYLLTHNGTSWSQVTGKDLYFQTLLPNSQKTWRIHSEVVSHPAIDNAEEAGAWGDATIAAKQAETLRGAVEIITGGTMMEDTLPLGKLAVNNSYLSAGVPIERITYQIVDTGLKTSFELGMELPKISKALAWIERQLARRVDSR